MTLQNCPSCEMQITTKNAIRVVRGDVDHVGGKSLWFNCPRCDSTFVILAKEVREELERPRFKGAA